MVATRFRLACRLTIALVLAWPASAWLQTAATPACALVLMHGKWGGPQGLAPFADKVEPACHVVLLEMPWSGRRSYDQPYPVALKEISAQVQTLRDKGYRRVLVGGQSFGTNAALAYMAEMGDADGVLALAPGHSPRQMYQQGMVRGGPGSYAGGGRAGRAAAYHQRHKPRPPPQHDHERGHHVELL